LQTIHTAAIKFAGYTHKGGPASYVSGNFAKGKTEANVPKGKAADKNWVRTSKHDVPPSQRVGGVARYRDAYDDYPEDRKSKGRNEGIQKVREYVRKMVREVLVERRLVRKEAYDPAAEGERASKLDKLAAKHGIKMRKGESRDGFEDRVSTATEGVVEGGPGSGPSGRLPRGEQHKGGDAKRQKRDVWKDSKWGDRPWAAKNGQGKVSHFISRQSAARWATK